MTHFDDTPMPESMPEMPAEAPVEEAPMAPEGEAPVEEPTPETPEQS